MSVAELRQRDVDGGLGDEDGFCVLVNVELDLRLWHGDAGGEELLELVVTLDDEGVEAHQVLTLLPESLLAGCKLENFCYASQIPSLIVVQVLVTLFVDDVKSLRCDYCGIYISVVDQISNNF